MPMIDLLWQSKEKRVMRETWGHLAPEPRRSYPGFVLFSVSPNGDHNLLDYDFDGLDGNPWTMEHVSDWWSRETEKARYDYRKSDVTRFWRWEGTYTECKNGNARLSGKTVEMVLSRKRSR